MFHHSAAPRGRRQTPLSSRVHARSLGIITHGLDMRINRMMAFSSCRGTPTSLIAYPSVGGHRRDGRPQVAPVLMSNDDFLSAAGSFEAHLSRSSPPSRQGGSGFRRGANGRQRHRRSPGPGAGGARGGVIMHRKEKQQTKHMPAFLLAREVTYNSNIIIPSINTIRCQEDARWLIEGS